MMRTFIESLRLSSSKVFGLVCAALVALALCVGIQAVAAQEAQADEYKYTVTLYAGNGAIDGGDEVTIGTYGYGQQAAVDVSKFEITPPDDRYYVKGVRLAGHDDSSVEAPVFTVKEDTQYVVAYGLKKDQTEYTVNYVDADGNQLAESQTFKGNIGDKPVVAYHYIEGYQPNALNMTGTLSGNKEANVFNFVYKAVPTGGVDGVDGVADAPEGDGTGTEVDATGEEGTGTEGADGAADEPLEIIDIDDEENPLAGIETESAQGFSIANVLPWVLGVAIAAALIALIVLLVARKRQGQNN